MKTLAIAFCIGYTLGVVFLSRLMGAIKRSPAEGTVKQDLDTVHDKYYRKIVESVGGQWVGIQETGMDEDLVLFNSLKTGSTLAVKTSACNEETVANRLAMHEDNWGQYVRNVRGRG